MIHSNISITGFFALVLIVLNLGCGQRKSAQYDREAFQREKESREIKRLSDAEITRAAYEQGAWLADTAHQIIFSSLHQQLPEKDSLQAMLQAYEAGVATIKDSLAGNHGATIRRVSLKTANKENLPNELEQLLLDSYLYNIENKLPLEDNVQEIDDYYFLYTKPIMVSSAECLRCHGEKGLTVPEQTYGTLKEHYPQNNAFGYQMQDFRGMWSIKLSKKELIRNL